MICGLIARRLRRRASGQYMWVYELKLSMEHNPRQIADILHRTIKEVFSENRYDYSLWKNWASCGEVAYGDVTLNARDGMAWFGGLCHCGSFFTCPYCGWRLALYRCNEIREGIHRWKQQNFHNDVYHLVFTFEHSHNESISELIVKMKDSNQDFFRDGEVREYLDDVGCVGKVTSFEVKYGSNSAHPHYHIALFATDAISIDEANDYLGDKWLQKLVKNGRNAIKNIGCKVEKASKLHNYLTKMSSEMALGNITKVKGGYTPMQLLWRYHDGDKRAGEVFCAMADCMKGKSCIKWSRGLRSYLGMAEKTDKQVIDDMVDFRDMLLVLDDKRDIRQFSHEERRLVLDCVRKGNLSLFTEILDKKRIKYWLNTEKAMQYE